jgi:hypothetical protein
MRTIKDGLFGTDSVGKLYVPVHHGKCTKSKSTAVKGKSDSLFVCPNNACDFIYYMNSHIM